MIIIILIGITIITGMCLSILEVFISISFFPYSGSFGFGLLIFGGYLISTTVSREKIKRKDLINHPPCGYNANKDNNSGISSNDFGGSSDGG